jgi:hypothetical protein
MIPASVPGFSLHVPCTSVVRRNEGLLVAGKRPTPTDRLGRTSRAAGVEVFYRAAWGRIRPAMMRC